MPNFIRSTLTISDSLQGINKYSNWKKEQIFEINLWIFNCDAIRQ